MTAVKSLDAIFFDVDGVLIDSMQVKAEAFAQAFDDVPNERERVMAFHFAHGGVTRSEKIRLIFELLFNRPPTSSEMQTRIDAFADAALTGVITATEIAGAHAVLSTWSAHTPLYAVSATPHDELLYILEKRGISQFLTSIHGYPPRKDLAVTAILAEEKYLPARCLLVGDSREDFNAAQTNGIAFIQVLAPGFGQFAGSTAAIADLTEFDSAVTAVLDRGEQ